MSHNAYLALGTNLGDRTENLRIALVDLSPAVCVSARSPIYETPPWGYEDQPPFLNQVVKVETELSPLELLHYIKELEKEMGRQPSVRFGPRLIDIDILFYDKLMLDSPKLTIPHPRMQGRAFVLLPLSDIAPDLMHPVLHMTIGEMLNETDTTGIHLFESAYE